MVSENVKFLKFCPFLEIFFFFKNEPAESDFNISLKTKMVIRFSPCNPFYPIFCGKVDMDFGKITF